MKILIAAVGRLKNGPERELVARYSERVLQIGRGVALGPLDIREIPESRSKRPEDRKREEAAALIAAIDPQAILVALDETGKTFSSAEFASRLARWRDDGAAAIQFVIGGADGLDPELGRRADMVLSFGRMTLPHQLVRGLLVEQVYRATTILAGHPYHRD